MSIYADLFRYRELFGNLFRRDLRVKYKGSALGVLWSLANPLLLLGVYFLVFSVLIPFKGSTIPHYALYLISGLGIWVFIAGAISSASRSLLENATLIRKVRFPRQLVPLSMVGTHLVSLVAVLAVLVPLNFALIPRTRDTVWLALPLVVGVIALVGGLALAIAAMNVVFRDVEFIVGALLLPWFFLTPILYSFQTLSVVQNHPTLVQVLRYGNFFTPPLDAVRDPLFWGKLPRAVDVVYLCVAALIALALGAFVFRRVDDRIAVEL